MNRVNASLFAFISFLAACSPDTGIPDKTLGVEDVPVVELTEVYSTSGNEEEFFGSPSSVKITKNENILVSDNASSSIFVLDSKGELINSFLKKGTGPGEVSFFLTPLQDEANKIHIYDNQQRKVSVFAPQGETYVFERSFTVLSLNSYFPTGILQAHENQYLVNYRMFVGGGNTTDLPDEIIVKLDREGQVIDSSFISVKGMETVFAEVGANRINVMRPFGTLTTIAPFEDGTLLKNWSGEFKFEHLSLSGEILNTFGLEVDPIPVTEQDKDAYRNSNSSFRHAFLANLPEFKPLVWELFISHAQQVWVRYGERSENRWMVFEKDGRPVVRLQAPENVLLTDATLTEAYGHPTGNLGTGCIQVEKLIS